MSAKSILFALLLSVTTLSCVAQNNAQGGATPAPNPLDTVADKMPFDLPYGAPITLDRAQAAIVDSDRGTQGTSLDEFVNPQS